MKRQTEKVKVYFNSRMGNLFDVVFCQQVRIATLTVTGDTTARSRTAWTSSRSQTRALDLIPPTRGRRARVGSGTSPDRRGTTNAKGSIRKLWATVSLFI